MAARLAAPPRTPSPKIRIHRSQSFDSPPSAISVTPIDDSPYSKSTGCIVLPKPLPRYDALQAAEHPPTERSRVLQAKMSDDSLMSDASSVSSSAQSSPREGSERASHFALLSASPSLPASASPSPSGMRARQAVPNDAPSPPEIPSLSSAIYQDMSTPMYDPWLVRVVLDMHDVRGFDWTIIAEPIDRIWGFKTSSAEVLGILSANGRVGRRWWD